LFWLFDRMFLMITNGKVVGADFASGSLVSRDRYFRRVPAVRQRSFHAAVKVTNRFRFQHTHLNSSSSRLGSRPTYRTRR